MVLRPLILQKNGFLTIQSKFRKQVLNISTTAVKQSDGQKNDDDCVIIKDLEGGKGLITLNRPKQLNTLNYSMVCKIRSTLLNWQECKYLVAVKGAGEKAFCAGGDVVAVTKDSTGEVGKNFFKTEYKMDALISSLHIPFVAFINGITMGGGVGISIFGKYRIATESTLFAMPETQIGLFPDVGVSYHLARMPKHLGNFLALTGYRLKGYDVVHAGVATHYCTQQKLPELEHALLCDFSKGVCSSPEEIINEFHETSLQGFKDCVPPPFTLEDNLSCIDKWFSACTLEEALEKMKEDSGTFASQTLDYMKKMSPLSLKITFKQIKDAADKDIYECFNTDYRIALRSLNCGDFVEGVRALLVDKDKKPKWKHSDISQVKEEEVNNFFCPLPDSDELNLPQSLCQD